MSDYEDSYDDDFEDDYVEERRKPGMSTSAKILIGVLIFGGVCVIACCGGIYWLSTSAFEMTEKPAEVVEMADSIASIDVPEEYQPTAGITVNVPFVNINMKMSVFARNPDNQEGGAVMLMQMSGPGMENEQQMRQQFEAQMEQQGQNKNIVEESSEIKNFTIDGEEVAFEFVSGKNPDTDKKVHQVTGLFPGQNGMVFLMIYETDENWDEEQVTKMIESISTDSSE